MELFSAGSSPPLEIEIIQRRISAKADLWTFLNEISGSITTWSGTKDDLVQEISHTTIRILHPHFTSPELQEEIKNIMATLKLERPDNFPVTPGKWPQF